MRPLGRGALIAMGIAAMTPPALGAWALRFDPLESAPQRILVGALIAATAIRAMRPVRLGPVALASLIPFALTTDLAALAPGPLVTLVASSAALIFFTWATTRRGLLAVGALAMMALMGLGQAAERLEFGLAVGLCLSCGFGGLILADEATPTLEGAQGRPHRVAVLWPLAVAALIAAPIMISTGTALPSLEPYITHWVGALLNHQGRRAQAGFEGGEAPLGGLSEILRSDAVVLRLWPEGSAALPERLRGQVYQTYRDGRWLPSSGAARRPVQPDGTLPLAEGLVSGRIRVEPTAEAPAFVLAPLNALTVIDAPPEATVDRLGVIRSPKTALWGSGPPYRLAVGPGELQRRLLPPTAEDVAFPESISPGFEAISLRWAPAGLPPEALTRALADRLMTYTYSLSLTPTPRGLDPLWHFLTKTRSGHCELFSGALVAMLRARGVPARWVTGFLVSELNPEGGYAIVRAQDAHAWAEVYYGGRWHTVDPTPPGASPGERRVLQGGWATWDALKGWLNVQWSRLGALPVTTLLLAVGALAALAFVWITLRRWRWRRARPAEIGFGPFAALSAHLGQSEGLQWSASEPLSRYAERVASSGRPGAAALIRRCVWLRYGGEGALPALEADVACYLEAGEPPAPE